MLTGYTLNGVFYRFNICYEDSSETKIILISCLKAVDNNKYVQFGQASYDSTRKIVKCQINYYDTITSPYINLEKEKNDFTKILNIAKEEIYKYNDKE